MFVVNLHIHLNLIGSIDDEKGNENLDLLVGIHFITSVVFIKEKNKI